MNIDVIGTFFFAIAILHTFLTSKILKLSHRLPKDSFSHGLLHLLGEIEVVFGFWAGVFFLVFAFWETPQAVVSYQESLNFTEPLFVFVIMVVAATKPVLNFAQTIIQKMSWILQTLLRTPQLSTDFFVILSFGPILGSFITEPAAMTVTALLIKNLARQVSKKLLYAVMAVLFVNVSIGGALTPFAAPPILMVAKTWGWDFSFIFTHFGWRSLSAVFLNAFCLVLFFRKDLPLSFSSLKENSLKQAEHQHPIPFGVTFLHLVILTLIVLTAHYQSVFMGLFLFFLGITVATKKFHDQLRLRESLLVAFFLAGIIVFGAFQKWWLQPLLSSLNDGALFYGSVLLTAVTDNAALTYLGSQVPNLTEAAKFALVAGAITGGGLTVIANAPNAAGYSILAHLFPGRIFSPLGLLVAAVPPTVVTVAMMFWV